MHPQVDISEVVIEQMRQRHDAMPVPALNVEYRVADCRSMPDFADHSYGTCIGGSQAC